jgi:hypothetical protein
MECSESNMNKSEDIKELAAAMLAVQKTALQATLNADNPYFGSKYADLAEVWRVAKEVLPDNGLVVFQSPSMTDGYICVETMLCHVSSGQWISGTVSLKPVKADPQAFGSCITYARRYGLACMVGIVADTDDDANAASQPATARRANTTTAVNPVIQRMQEVLNAPIVATPGTVPSWEPDPEPTLPSGEAWKAFAIPYGPDKGKTLGMLSKSNPKKLWGWWANYVPKPWTGKDGVPRPPSASDIALRAALDAAGAYCKFSKTGESEEPF